jgi:glucokinase-like ROK family protein
LLYTEKLVEQVGMGESNGGRPPLMIRFVGEDHYVVGIDWGKTHIYGVLADLNAKVIHELDIPSEEDNDFNSDLEKVMNLIQYIIQKSSVDPEKILGIGIAAAGYVNKRTGVIEYSPNFNWFHSNIKEPLEKKFGVPVKVGNVSRVMAMGELLYGLGNKFQNFILVNVGYGIGSGIIISGRPYDGFDGFSGEIGHTKIACDTREKRVCACGKINCLECYASGRGIAETVLKRYNENPDSILRVLCNGNKELITAEMVSKAAKSGDAFSLEVFSEAAEILGQAIANMAIFLNPEGIILGGKVLKSGRFYLDKVTQVFNQEYLKNAHRKISIHVSDNIERGAAIGAVSLILKEVLDLS